MILQALEMFIDKMRNIDAPVVLELGGKDASIVLEDADLERAARGVAWGAFQNAGQSCISVERVFVVEEVYDAFLRALLAEVKKITAGWTAEAEVGPMVVAAAPKGGIPA